MTMIHTHREPCLMRRLRLLATLALCAAGTVCPGPVSAAGTPSAAASGTHKPNRLAQTSSPYLLQHAHNPVNWYPWGPEALAEAKKQDRPIFLSIGYSSCHWCHVMERLVFENEEIAEALNQNFICIKVDREERPDLDDIYMTSLLVYFRAIGSPQGGGWPLSMFLTPDGRPFAGGTYFPPKDQEGQPGFLTVASRISGLWTEQRKAIEQNADVITAQVRRNMKPALVLETVPLEPELITSSVDAVLESYDPKFGGFDFDPEQPDAPKFPVESRLALLQYSVRRLDSEQAATAAYNTLDHILRGGLRDHLGGGFHRYSTDRRWQVPHFEKMLYNQAQLADVFTEAWRRTGQQKYRRAVEETLDFVLRDLTAPEGGFYSSLDAETGGVEGKYYVWSPEEVKQVLAAEDAALFIEAYSLDSPSGFEPGHVLALSRPLAELAAEAGLPENDFEARLIRAGQQLLEVRGRREPLRRDDKVLTAWNGLMIAALARSGKLMDRPVWVQAAAKAAEFVAGQMRDEEGRLLRSWREGQAGLNAYLDDYAFFIRGLLELHLATGEQKWLNAARRLTDQQVAQFADKDRGGFYFTATHHEELLTRTRNAWDGALPSGNGVAIQNLIRLASFTGEDSYRIMAEQALAAFAPVLSKSPRSAATLAVALGEFLDKPDFSTSGPVAAPARQGSPAPATPGAGGETSATAAAEDPGPMEPEPSSQNSGVILQTAGEKPADKEEKKKEIVRARAFLDVDRLPAGGTCRIVLFLDIEKPWHINANPAMPDFLVPTELNVESKQGLRLTALRYPAARKATLPGFEQPLNVYSGRAIIYGTITIPPTAADKVEMGLRVKYQACDDSRCLPPKTIRLDGNVPVARPGEQVKKINANLFPKPNRRPR